MTSASLASAQRLTFTQPDDWHVHLRDGAVLQTSVAHTASQCARAIVMPNLQPPVTQVQQALDYRSRIMAACPSNTDFTPLMTLYLTDNTSAQDIAQAHAAGIVACKLYPAGATTNSAAGVTNLKNCYSALEAMQRHHMPLLIHGEVTDAQIDIFDREAVFIERVLQPLRNDFPELKIVLEHITTKEAAQYVAQAGTYTAATITPQHLLYNRNAILVGGIHPHYYCLPILKREQHRQALVQAATSGKPCYFLGTDSAPHAAERKESACGCAGCYTAPQAIQLYAEAFDAAGALDRLEGFASHFGADFYGLPRNTKKITLERTQCAVPTSYDWGDSTVKPLRAGQTVAWQVVSIL